MARVARTLPLVGLTTLLLGSSCEVAPPEVRARLVDDPAVDGEGGADPPAAVADAGPEGGDPDAGATDPVDAGLQEPAPDAGPPQDDPPVPPPPPPPPAPAPTCDDNAAIGDYCAGDKVSHGVDGTLYRCNGPGPAAMIEACALGCFVAPAGQDDYCTMPAPTCDDDAFTGDYCAGDKVSHGVEETLYRCDGPGPATALEACADGCVVAPPGYDDYCANGDCPHHDLLRWGLAPDASDQLRCAGVPAWRVVQTIGDAAASAGYHARDGTIDGHEYCAATDLSSSGMSNSEIRALLARLADGGFAGFYRWPGHDGWPSSESPHLHVIYAGVPMKWQLDEQVVDWLNGRNGLSSHTSYTFWQPTDAQRAHVRALFEGSN